MRLCFFNGSYGVTVILQSHLCVRYHIWNELHTHSMRLWRVIPKCIYTNRSHTMWTISQNVKNAVTFRQNHTVWTSLNSFCQNHPLANKNEFTQVEFARLFIVLNFWDFTIFTNLKFSSYRLGMVNSNTVNSKFHLIRSYCEIFFYHIPNISCLK